MSASLLRETLNDFIIGNNVNTDAIENESLEPQSKGFVNNFGTSSVGENSIGHDQGFGKNIADKIRKEVDNAIMVVENRVHDGILAAMDNVIIPRVEMAVKSIIESSGRGAGSMVQNPDQRDF